MKYRRLTYTDVQEKLERFIKEFGDANRNYSHECVAQTATLVLKLPIQPGWVAIARGDVARVIN